MPCSVSIRAEASMLVRWSTDELYIRSESDSSWLLSSPWTTDARVRMNFNCFSDAPRAVRRVPLPLFPPLSMIRFANDGVELWATISAEPFC